MKKRSLILTAGALIIGIGICSTIPLIGQNTEKSILTRYEFLGIDAEKYQHTDTPYVQEVGICYEWNETNEKPVLEWEQYTTEDGAMLAFDEQGRLRKFMNTDSVFYQRELSAEKLSAEALEEKAQSVAKQVLGSLDGYTMEQCILQETNGADYQACSIVWQKEVAASQFDTIGVELLDDGQIRAIGITYCDLQAECAQKLDTLGSARLNAYIEKEQAAFTGNIAPEISNYYYRNIEGMVYGFYEVTFYDTPVVDCTDYIVISQPVMLPLAEAETLSVET